MGHIHRPYLIYLEAVYLQKLISILRHLRDVNVQLKVPHRKGAEVLNLNRRQRMSIGEITE